jgi:hypothetical protein
MKRVCALLLIGASGAGSAQSADGERGFYVGARASVASGTQAGVPFTVSSSSKREGKLYLETGVSYRFDEHWKANLGLTHLSDIGDKDRTGRADIRNVFLGLSHPF